MDILKRIILNHARNDYHCSTGIFRLLNIACAAKARTRNVTLARPNRDEVLNFSILGGFERGFGIFISKVDKRSKAEDVGLKRGDQILEVNGQSFEHVNHAKALDILRASTHLSITVKSNLLGECKHLYFQSQFSVFTYVMAGLESELYPTALTQSTLLFPTRNFR